MIAVLDAENNRLRHIDLDAQHIGPRDGEHGRPARSIGGDETADIDEAAGDHAVERRGDLFEAGRAAPAGSTAACCATTLASATCERRRLGQRRSAGPDRPAAGSDHPCATSRGCAHRSTRPDRRWPVPGPPPPASCSKLRLRLGKLLIEVGGGDQGEHIAFAHLAANIDVADADIAGGAGTDGRAVEAAMLPGSSMVRGSVSAVTVMVRTCGTRPAGLPARRRRPRRRFDWLQVP